MDKSVFIKNVLNFAEQFNVKLEDMHVSHGGSLLLLGLKESTGDVDLTVTEEVYNALYQSTSDENWVELEGGRILIGVELNDGSFVDVHEAEDPNVWDHLLIDSNGIRYRNAQRTKDDYINFGRKTDDVKIKLLDDHLNCQ